MTVLVRNLGVPDVAAGGGSALLITVRELLRVARWTEVSNNGDAGWPDVGGVVNNLVAAPSDLQVDPANPRRITSLSSPFTSGMVGNMIALLATNDRNRSMWRIDRFLDANNIEVDQMGFSPWNWALETGISGRVTKVTTVLTAPTATTLWNAPSPSVMQARLLQAAVDTQTMFIRPKGQVPLATECTGISYADSVDLKHRMHMIVEDENTIIWWSTEDTGLEFVMWGKLIDADTGDTHPNFILGRASAHASDLYTYYMYMLDGSDSNIQAFVTAIKKNWSARQDTNFTTNFNARFANNGYGLLRSPWVCLANTITVGACVRGRVPLIAQSYNGYEQLRPMDAVGLWLHTYGGLMVPRDGPLDKLPMVPTV